jgi:hypothetical protein
VVIIHVLMGGSRRHALVTGFSTAIPGHWKYALEKHSNPPAAATTCKFAALNGTGNLSHVSKPGNHVSKG